ncbi:MAG: heavy-metal-associated domain-containing protein [Clostridiales bacterium]|nr:heavy-metal-associated domain-containing protein [Clostridiales bacterium]
MTAALAAAVAALVAWAAVCTVRRMRRGGGCCGEHEAPVAKSAVKDRDRAHYPYETELQIGGMTCDNCARRVENALNALPDTWARVDLGERQARVRTKQPPDMAALNAAVRSAGYVVMR